MNLSEKLNENENSLSEERENHLKA